MPRTAGNRQELDEVGEVLPSLREAQPCRHLGFELTGSRKHYEGKRFCHFKDTQFTMLFFASLRNEKLLDNISFAYEKPVLFHDPNFINKYAYPNWIP